MYSECFRAGNAGQCGTEFCETLVLGNCDVQDEIPPERLYELGLIGTAVIENLKEFVSDPVCPDAVIKETPEDAYERAMEILN